MRTVIPVTHEFEAYLHVPNLNLYHAFVNYYSENVTSRNKYRYSIKDRHGRKFKFWSKQGGLINPKTDKLAFEYAFHWESKDKASKCHITVKPLFGKGTRTKTGKILNLPDVGTNITVQSSYFSLEDILDLYEDILAEIDASRFVDKIDYSRSRIKNLARHVRYHEKHEADVVGLLKAIKSESVMRGDVKIIEDVASGMYKMYKLDIPNFEPCGIKPEFVHNIKSYRIENFLDRDPTDPLRHPKLEVFLNSREHERNFGKYPTLKDYHAIIRDQDKHIASLMHIVSPKYSIEYVPDSYFDPLKQYTIRHELTEWDYK